MKRYSGSTIRRLEIQKYIKEFNDIEYANDRLTLKFNVDVKPATLVFDDSKEEEVWLYKLSKNLVNRIRPIEEEAFSIVLDKNGEIVSRPYKRPIVASFNNRKVLGALDWSYKPLCEVEYDGEMVILYNRADKFFMQSVNCPIGSDSDTVKNVLNIFEQKFGPSPFSPFKEDSKYCWVFKYVAPPENNLTSNNSEDVILLAMINKDAGIELVDSYVDVIAKNRGLTRPKKFEVDTPRDIPYAMSLLEPLDIGLSVQDVLGRRVLIKNQKRTALLNITEGTSKIRAESLANIVLKMDVSKISAENSVLLTMQETLSNVVSNIAAKWVIIGDLEHKASFAEAIKDQPFSSILFGMRKGIIKNVEEVIQHIKPKQLITEVENTNNIKIDEVLKQADITKIINSNINIRSKF